VTGHNQEAARGVGRVSLLSPNPGSYMGESNRIFGPSRREGGRGVLRTNGDRTVRPSRVKLIKIFKTTPRKRKSKVTEGEHF